jgi:hypothetical protein
MKRLLKNPDDGLCRRAIEPALMDVIANEGGFSRAWRSTPSSSIPPTAARNPFLA